MYNIKKNIYNQLPSIYIHFTTKKYTREEFNSTCYMLSFNVLCIRCQCFTNILKHNPSKSTCQIHTLINYMFVLKNKHLFPIFDSENCQQNTIFLKPDVKAGNSSVCCFPKMFNKT